MRQAILLRVAAVLAAIQGSAHGILVNRYHPSHGDAEVALVEAMQANVFAFGGVNRSYWDFYFGYAMFNAFACLVEAILFWRLGQASKDDNQLVSTVALVFALFNIGHAAIAARYFIVTPIVFDAAIAALLTAAAFRSRQRAPA